MESNAGMGGDGSKCLSEWEGMDVGRMGMGLKSISVQTSTTIATLTGPYVMR